MNVKRAYVLIVISIMRLMRWRQTTLRLGVQAAKLFLLTVRCAVRNVTGARATLNKTPILYKMQTRDF